MVVVQWQEPPPDLVQQSVIESRGVLMDKRFTCNGPLKIVHYWKTCAGGDLFVTRDLLGGLIKNDPSTVTKAVTTANSSKNK